MKNSSLKYFAFVSEKHNEAGIVAIVTALLVVILVTLVGIVSTYGYGIVIKSELQLASDAAALAGASQLCPTTACRENALNSAKAILKEHTARGNLEDNSSLDVDQMTQRLDGQGNLQNIWDGDNISVEIERGQWSNRNGFRSVDANWETSHPGAPKEIITNAVRVRLTRPRYTGLFSALNNFAASVSAEAVSASSPVEPSRVAPFAVPVCALLNENSEFKQSELCYGDRIYTKADRYCDDGGDCDVIPTFQWQPCSEEAKPFWDRIGANAQYLTAGYCDNLWSDSSGDARLSQQCNGSDPLSSFPPLRQELSMPVNSTPIGCYINNTLTATWFPTSELLWGFRMPRYSSIADHFGLVGIPGNIPIPTEAQIVAAINTGNNPGFDAQIGDRFSILADGLLSPEANDAISRQISDTFSFSNDESHPKIVDTTAGTLNNLGTSQRLYVRQPIDFYGDSSSGSVSSMTFGGLCNSMKIRLDLNAVPPTPPDSVDAYGQGYDAKIALQSGVNDDSTVWRINIPVIADMSADATSCQSASNPKDPKIDLTKNYEIVGFVQAEIFDADISQNSPARISADMVSPWGFTAQGLNRCNLVRSRISCNNNFIASSEPTAANRSARLVAQAIQ